MLLDKRKFDMRMYLVISANISRHTSLQATFVILSVHMQNFKANAILVSRGAIARSVRYR
jgi:hypothetical protein